MNKKKISKNTKNISNRSSRFFALFVAVLLSGIIVSFDSIRAQIESIYDRNSGEVAGITPLMSAVVSNDVGGVRFFSKAGESIINKKNIGGASALHLAARSSNIEIAKILLENKADVNIVDNEAWTPLMRASVEAKDEMVALLLENNADASLMNNLGESAIIHASQSDCSKCLLLMFDKFDFFKSMRIKTLKDQLSKAYLVATNHENEESKKILEEYLDKVSKLEKLTQDSADKVKKAFTINSPEGAQDAVAEDLKYYLLMTEDEVESVEAEEEVEEDSKIVPVMESEEVDLFVEQEPEKKNFKFIPGAESKKIISKIARANEEYISESDKTENKAQKKYKFSNTDKVENIPTQNEEEVDEKYIEVEEIEKADIKEVPEKKSFVLKKGKEKKPVEIKEIIKSEDVRNNVKSEDKTKKFRFKKSKPTVTKVEEKAAVKNKVPAAEKINKNDENQGRKFLFKKPQEEQKSKLKLDKEDHTISKSDEKQTPASKPSTFKFKKVVQKAKTEEKEIVKDIEKEAESADSEVKKIYKFPNSSNNKSFKPLDIFRKEKADDSIEIDLLK